MAALTSWVQMEMDKTTTAECWLLFGRPGPGGFTGRVRLIMIQEETQEEIQKIAQNLLLLNEEQAKALEDYLLNPSQEEIDHLYAKYTALQKKDPSRWSGLMERNWYELTRDRTFDSLRRFVRKIFK